MIDGLRSSDAIDAAWHTAVWLNTAQSSWVVSQNGQVLSSRYPEHRYPSASMIKSYLYWILISQGQDLQAPVTIDRDLFSAGDGVLNSLTVDNLPLGDLASLMWSVSDNSATNHVIKALGGPDTINRSLAEKGSTARLRGWLGGVGEAAHDREFVLAEQWLRTDSGLGVVAASDYWTWLLGGQSPGSRNWDFPALQLDRRSLARFVRDEVPFAHKSGTVYGVRHDAGEIEELAIVCFSESLDLEEYVDHPACVGMASAAAWTLRILGEEDLLVPDAPEVPSVLAGPLALTSPDDVNTYFARDDIRDTLRSLQSELEFWASARVRLDAVAFTLVTSKKAVGIACLYGTGIERSVGIYLFRPDDYRQGLGSAAFSLLERAARSRGVARLVWTCASDNTASMSLARELGFTLVGVAPKARVRDAGAVDEVRYEMPVDGSGRHS